MQPTDAGLRLVLVSSRYWPLVSETERWIANLAIELRSLGARPTIVSARWSSNWPAYVSHQGVPVVRLSPPPRGGWSNYRYVRELSRWLRKGVNQFDVVHVSGLRHEAYGAVTAVVGRNCPVVLQPHGSGVHGDCTWQATTRVGKRIRRRCREAQAVLATTEADEHELLAAGYAREQIVRIPTGARLPAARTGAMKEEARKALAAVNHDLAAPPMVPVAVCIQRLIKDRALDDLLRAWREVGKRFPNAALWIVGDGPDRKEIFEQIVDMELHHRVFLPGSFDDLEEVLLAADVCVVPTTESGSTTLDAMAAGLPVVSVSSSDSRAMMEAGHHGLLFPEGEPSALAAAVCQIIESQTLGARLGKAARQRVQEQHSLKVAATRHLELYQRLLSLRERTSG